MNKMISNHKIILGMAAVLICCFAILYGWQLFQSHWLGGSGCIYDKNGFKEMKNGETINQESGHSILCNDGRLIFK